MTIRAELPSRCVPHPGETRTWGWLVGLVMLAGGLTGFVGLGDSLPLESHEIYVARTAEEMINRGDWLVPYFNDAPRLRKPPLSYWLVIACDRLHDGNGLISEFEARFPSALAGVALVGLTIALGCAVANRRTGLIAGLIVASSSGYIAYTHCARPEMLYAALSTAGLLAFIRAERWFTDPACERRSRWAAWLGWTLFGLATLTKGPQLPLMILLGWLVGAIWLKRWRTTLRALRPFSGIAICLIVSLWWFAAIWLTVPDAAEIWRGETVDRYVGNHSRWWGWLEPYYLYRPAGLILPWVLLYPLALLLPWNRGLKGEPDQRRLWWIVVAAMVVLSFSIGRRWYYMLPVLAPLAVLMAATGLQLASEWWTSRSNWKWLVVLGLHVIAIAIAAILMIEQRPDLSGHVTTRAIVLILIAAVSALVFLIHPALRARIGPAGCFGAVLAFTIIAFSSAAHTSAFWRAKRVERRDFVAQVSEYVEPPATLIGWEGTWVEEQYYLHRPIQRIRRSNEVERTLRAHDPTWLLVDVNDAPPTLSARWRASIEYQADYDGDVGRLQLWRITAQRSEDEPSRSPDR